MLTLWGTVVQYADLIRMISEAEGKLAQIEALPLPHLPVVIQKPVA
jgi:hypothetical protein